MMTSGALIEFMRGTDLGARVRALGYQVTVMQDCDSIYIADACRHRLYLRYTYRY